MQLCELSYAILCEFFKKKLFDLGSLSEEFRSHSLHAGGATAAANAGVPDYQHGRQNAEMLTMATWKIPWIPCYQGSKILPLIHWMRMHMPVVVFGFYSVGALWFKKALSSSLWVQK